MSDICIYLLCSPLPTSVLRNLTYMLGRKKPTNQPNNTKGYTGYQGNVFTGANKLTPHETRKFSAMVCIQPCPDSRRQSHSPHQLPGCIEVCSSAASASLCWAQGVLELGATNKKAGPTQSCSSCSQLLNTALCSRDSWHRLGSQRFPITKSHILAFFR